MSKKRPRRMAGIDDARWSLGTQIKRDIGRITNCGVLVEITTTNIPCHDFARVKPKSKAQWGQASLGNPFSKDF